MLAQKLKIKLYDNQDCTGDVIGTIELSFFDTTKALTMIEDIIRPAYNEMGLPCSFSMELVDYDI